jgi:hypothetical protein
VSFKSWDFGAHFSAPEMLGFERTVFCTETLSFFGAFVSQSNSRYFSYISACPKPNFILLV